MDLDDVRLFTRVVALGSFTRAAEQLAIPKSTVSRRVGQLEESLGVVLLNRTTRKLYLTQAGEVYYARCSRAIEELEQAAVELEELESEPRGLLRITTPGDLSRAIPDLLTDFQLRFPKVEIVVFATGRRVDLVVEGFDVALRAGQLPDSSLIARKLLSSTMRLFASPAYLKEKGQPTSPEDLIKHECLIFSDENVFDTWTLLGPGGQVDVPIRGRLASRDLNLLRAAAVAGRGIAFLPDLTGAPDSRCGVLSHVLPEYWGDVGGLYAVYPAARRVSPKVRVFVDFCAEWLTSHGRLV